MGELGGAPVWMNIIIAHGPRGHATILPHGIERRRELANCNRRSMGPRPV